MPRVVGALAMMNVGDNLFSVHHETLDNDRYADVEWTGANDIISKI